MDNFKRLSIFDSFLPKKASSRDLLFHLGSAVRSIKPVGSELLNLRVQKKKQETIITKRASVNKIQLPGCVALNDKLFQNLCYVTSLQQDLRNLNIYGTSVSPEMAASLFYCLPHLETFVYHDISGFLHCANMNKITSDSLPETRVCKLQLGMVHDATIHLTFSNCKTGTSKSCKELELYLPDCVSKGKKNDIFQFAQDKYGMYGFLDVYRVIVAVKPEQIFGGLSDAYPLTEMSLFSVKDIDLELVFSKLKTLRKMLLHSCYINVKLRFLGSESSVNSDSILTLHLCKMMTDDVVKIVGKCPKLKDLYLYDLQLTNNIFECMNKLVKVSIKNCCGCPFRQILYRLQLPRCIARLKQYDRWSVV